MNNYRYSEFQVNIFSNIRDIENVKVFTHHRQGYDNISTFSLKTAKLKIETDTSKGATSLGYLRMGDKLTIFRLVYAYVNTCMQVRNEILSNRQNLPKHLNPFDDAEIL